MSLRLGVGSLLFTSALAFGCAELREHTYPRDLRYISVGEVRTAMLRLAAGAAELDRLLTGEPDDPELNGKVVAQLREMTDAALTIDPGAARATHPELERHLETFRLALSSAADEAKASPPNYYLAGTIVGACTSCHAPSRK